MPKYGWFYATHLFKFTLLATVLTAKWKLISLQTMIFLLICLQAVFRF